MKICFPVAEDLGVESEVYGHFGSSPQFLVVDTKTRVVTALNNRDQHHAHGACQPLKALGGQDIDAIVVGGIGGGALTGLNRAGLRVYRAEGLTIAENIACFAEGELSILTPAQTCGGHAAGSDQGGGCHH